MTEEQRLTRKEWLRRSALEQCAAHGHEWSIVQNHAGGPMAIRCDSCGWSGQVSMGPRPTA